MTARVRRLAGDYAGAAGLLRTAVEACGPDTTEMTTLLNELGMVGKYAGDFAAAEDAYRRALTIEQRAGRGAGPDAAAILHNLGGLAHARGRPAAALPLALRGISIRSALPEPDPAGLAADRAALAAILIDLGRHDEARRALLDLIDSDAPRPDVAAALHNLGSLQFREGDAAEAAATLRRAVRLKTDELGPRHPDLAVTLHNLACCLRKLGLHRQARQNLKEAVAILDGRVAPDHPTLVACRRKLAER
jgi:tetratricopeptide (TPR) repeat protein